MTERSIYFPQPTADAMVQAVLADRKTQHRQPVKPSDSYRVCSPFGEPGDRLRVQEAWLLSDLVYHDDNLKMHYRADQQPHKCCPPGLPVPRGNYKAAQEIYKRHETERVAARKSTNSWRSPANMPRWACRITRVVKRVWVEEVQDITEADAVAEGFQRREHFIRAWDSIYAAKGCGFDANPSVWGCEFEVSSR